MGYYGENDAKIIVSGILEAVQYLHQLGILFNYHSNVPRNRPS